MVALPPLCPPANLQDSACTSPRSTRRNSGYVDSASTSRRNSGSVLVDNLLAVTDWHIHMSLQCPQVVSPRQPSQVRTFRPSEDFRKQAKTLNEDQRAFFNTSGNRAFLSTMAKRSSRTGTSTPESNDLWSGRASFESVEGSAVDQAREAFSLPVLPNEEALCSNFESDLGDQSAESIDLKVQSRSDLRSTEPDLDLAVPRRRTSEEVMPVIGSRSNVAPRRRIKKIKVNESITDHFHWKEVIQEDGDGKRVVLCFKKSRRDQRVQIGDSS